jgi:glycerophosphoryl diester phosphodiesterase
MHHALKIGHRGAAGHAPENTLAAVRKGIALGVDFVEIDIRRTADGRLVVLHDATVNRTTDGKGRIESLWFQDLEKLDAGDGERIPTLAEVLKVATGKTGLMVELKIRGEGQQTVETVREAGFKGPVIYASFFHDELTHIRKADPDASLMLLFGSLSRASVSRAIKYGSSYVGLPHNKATGPLVNSFHRAGLLVFVYTVNDPDDIRRVLSLGVDGVISNFPDRIVNQ